MIYVFFAFPVSGLILSIIGITKRVKWAWLMCIMWTINIVGYILNISIHLWWPIFAVAELAFFIQIIWIMLASKAMRKEL